MIKFRIQSLLIILVILFGFACSPNTSDEITSGTLITGATLINPGAKTEIIPSSYLYFEGNEIISYGSMADAEELPNAATVIDASGKYIMPGLVDGFATLNNQAYANAYLYKGITTILEVDEFRRGPFYDKANPSPDTYRLDGIAEESMATEDLIPWIDSLYNNNIKVLLMMYSLTPEQTKIVYEHAHSLGMATIGEMATTTYAQGMGIGIDAFCTLLVIRWMLRLKKWLMQWHWNHSPTI